MVDFQAICEDFASLDDWEDRYRYIIDLGNELPRMEETARNEQNKVRGCVSQVWLEHELRTNADGELTLRFRGDSDSSPGARVDRHRARAFFRSIAPRDNGD